MTHFSKTLIAVRVLCQFLAVSALFGALAVTSLAQAKTIVVSIPPLAAMVMPLKQPEDRVITLLKPGQSPHTYQLKPSQMLALQRAEVIFGVGTEVDLWMAKALRQRKNAPVIWMNQQAGIVHLPVRGVHHHEAPAHAHNGDHDHDHDEKTNEIDPHLWLSPKNAQIMMQTMVKALQTPTNQADQALNRLQETDRHVQQMLNPVKSHPFMVLHDAFHYFENHYGLNNQGVIQLNPTLKPSVRHLLALRERIQSHHVHCIIKEPQFPQSAIRALIRGLDVKVVSADPLGTSEQTYPRFLNQVAHPFKQCLERE